MIIKQADAIQTSSRRAQAGAKAEKQMAFYLGREFGDHCSDVLVFHDLRLKLGKEVAQIDHLVVHRHGLFIIESKSISGEIHINADGEFSRHSSSGGNKGMQSPVQQAMLQADLLRRLLIENKTRLRDRKLLGLVQGGFKHCPIEIRVAISDKGIIRGGEYAPEVCKADRIVDEIKARIAGHRKGGRLTNLDLRNKDGMYVLSPGEIERLCAFLLEQHQPKASHNRKANDQTAETVQSHRGGARVKARDVAESAESAGTKLGSFSCRNCQSIELRILYGRNYYFKCQKCGQNTPADKRLDATGREGRIRKDGDRFYLADPESGTERLYYVNRSSSK